MTCLYYGPSVAFLERKNKRYKLLSLNERKQGLFSLLLLVVYQASSRPFLKTKHPFLNFTNHVLLHSRISTSVSKTLFTLSLCRVPFQTFSPTLSWDIPRYLITARSQSKNSSIWCKATSIAYNRLFSGQKIKNNVLARKSVIYNLFCPFNPPVDRYPKGFCDGFWYANHVSLAHFALTEIGSRYYENDIVRCCRRSPELCIHSSILMREP